VEEIGLLSSGRSILNFLRVISSSIFLIHKVLELEDFEQRYPAGHYVLIDNKRRILSAVKKIWITRVTTVFPREGHDALDPRVLERFPQADLSIERIGDLLPCDLQTLLSAGMA
jgi:hypothetical protein